MFEHQVGGGTLPNVILIMCIHWVVFMTLYWYLENVMVVGHGTSKSCCFCLDSCLANKNNSNGDDAATEGDKKKTNNDVLLLDRIPNKVMQGMLK